MEPVRTESKHFFVSFANLKSKVHMPGFCLKALLFLALFSISSNGIAQVATAENSALSKHDLQWLKTKTDFNQKGMLPSAIEEMIGYTIRQGALFGKLTETIEVPFNHTALHYMGYVHPMTLGLFDANVLGPKNSDEINKSLYVYRYECFYFSTETDSANDQQNVFYAIRALNILKYRYPLAYNMLIAGPMNYPILDPRQKNYINKNKVYWVAFNTHPRYIAVSGTSYQKLPGKLLPGSPVEAYANVPVISIHARNILGNKDTIGTYPLYQQPMPQDNCLLYLREGIMESIVHELLHRYIDYLSSVDSTCSYIVAHRNTDNLVDIAEENAVVNTSLSYFIRMGGIGIALPNYYYPEIFYDNIATLRQAGKLDEYSKMISGDTTGSKDGRRSFRFRFLDGQ